jgi:predicted nucleotidyltransferase
MRLTDRQRTILKEETAAAFGPQAQLRLFGSRVDDHTRGGDIDIHIEAEGTESQLLQQELHLRTRLQARLGERRIDGVVHGHDTNVRPIDRSAHDTGVVL